MFTLSFGGDKRYSKHSREWSNIDLIPFIEWEGPVQLEHPVTPAGRAATDCFQAFLQMQKSKWKCLCEHVKEGQRKRETVSGRKSTGAQEIKTKEFHLKKWSGTWGGSTTTNMVKSSLVWLSGGPSQAASLFPPVSLGTFVLGASRAVSHRNTFPYPSAKVLFWFGCHFPDSTD